MGILVFKFLFISKCHVFPTLPGKESVLTIKMRVAAIILQTEASQITKVHYEMCSNSFSWCLWFFTATSEYHLLDNQNEFGLIGFSYWIRLDQ